MLTERVGRQLFPQKVHDMNWADGEVFVRPSEIIPMQLQEFEIPKSTDSPHLYLLHIKMSQKYFEILRKSKSSYKTHAGETKAK